MIMVILGILSWPGVAYMVRAQVLAERQKEFVTAAKALGVRERNIIFRHIVPNVMTIIIVKRDPFFCNLYAHRVRTFFPGIWRQRTDSVLGKYAE